jgi:hypothetical protein
LQKLDGSPIFTSLSLHFFGFAVSLRRSAVISITVFALVLTGPGANAMLLDYSAYVGQTKVGEAQVSIDLRESGYQISGEAQSTGLMGLFSKWSSLFNIRGLFAFGGKPVASEYQVSEQSGGKNKQIVYQGDQVHVSKNGKARHPRPLPAGTDFWSLLFLSDNCDDASLVHDGKDLWEVTPKHSERLADGRSYCEFELVDEDQERSTVAIWLKDIGELKVPVQLEFQGAMRGTFKLTDHELD